MSSTLEKNGVGQIIIFLYIVKDTRNGNLLPKLFWPTVIKNCSSDREKLANFLRSLETIYSNSETSEQFLLTECFNLFLDVSHK